MSEKFEAPVGRAAFDDERTRHPVHLDPRDWAGTFWAKVAGITAFSIGEWAFKHAAPPADDPWGQGNPWPLAAFLVGLLWTCLALIAASLLPLGLFR